jgi:hypothetical protein
LLGKLAHLEELVCINALKHLTRFAGRPRHFQLFNPRGLAQSDMLGKWGCAKRSTGTNMAINGPQFAVLTRQGQFDASAESSAVALNSGKLDADPVVLHGRVTEDCGIVPVTARRAADVFEDARFAFIKNVGDSNPVTLL